MLYRVPQGYLVQYLDSRPSTDNAPPDACPHRLPIMLLLLLLFVLQHALRASAGFDQDKLEGLYRLRAGIDGLPRCGDLLVFSSSGTDIPAADIKLDDEQCVGGNLFLVKNPESGGTGFVPHFFRHPASGDFFAGQLGAQLVCGDKTFGDKGTTFVFVQPNEDITITWEDVAGMDTPLETVTASVYTFQRGVAYIIINNRCLYTRDDNVENVRFRNHNDGSVCFPSHATVRRDDGQLVPMHQLQTGDRVAVGAGNFSPVFAWTHRDSSVKAKTYVSIDAGLSRPLTLTPSHFVHASGRTVPAASVRKGDVMTAENGSSVVVRAVTEVQSRGLFNPQTLHGDIVVDGLVVSTYTTTVEQAAAHALLAPVRAAFRCAGNTVGSALLRAVETVLLWQKS